ncbi:MAG: carboxynorspermidine decarboxylase [Verrucomicrobiaceae bacterium]|nr:MAG: carboxynorspermidine decarboxylase [Verrucomicrobiaceae bacterium]
MPLPTPYYLIDEARMLPAMERIRFVQQHSGAKCVLALKCFSSWCAFDFMKEYLVGTTSSSLWETRLGHEKFGGETHGYSVAFGDDEIAEVVSYCDKIIFNSLSQFERLAHHAGGISVGLRLNPGIGHSCNELSNPVCQYSRLGVRAEDLTDDIGPRIQGAMIHVNCDNADFESFSSQLDFFEEHFSKLLPQLDWLSLGGGVAFTDDGYPLEDFCQRLREFSEKHSLQIYLEPGEASVANSTSLVVRVLDIVENEVPTLIVDAGVETHLLDVLTYDYTPELEGAETLARDAVDLASHPGHVYRVCGRTCLAGDHFGNYAFSRPVAIGDELHFPNVGGYSMVKKNFFNGIRMPAIYHGKLSGEIRLVQQPTYEDFREALTSSHLI